MRRIISNVPAMLLVLAVGLMPSACKQKEKARIEVTDEAPVALASQVNVADPKAAPQLVKGFHETEGNAWRWTKGKFSVTLHPPLNAPQKGATLVVKLSIPDLVMQRLQSITLSANVNGVPIPGETFSKSGDQVYSKDVPASALSGDAVTIEFSLDKFLPPGAVDRRELGIVVSSIGFEAK